MPNKMHALKGFDTEVDADVDAIGSSIIDAAGTVRRELGAGLYERIYERALTKELQLRGHSVLIQVPHAALYRGEELGLAFRADLVVDGRVLIELKAIEGLHPRHAAQTLTYLRISGLPLGFLINFNAVPLGDGIRRFANTKT